MANNIKVDDLVIYKPTGKIKKVVHTYEGKYVIALLNGQSPLCVDESRIELCEFKEGDRVRVKNNAAEYHQGYQNGYAWLPSRDIFLNKETYITKIAPDGNIFLKISGDTTWWRHIDLIKSNMEKKELNLCEILNDYDGKEYYNILSGRAVNIVDIKRCSIYISDAQNEEAPTQCLTSKGQLYHNGVCILYPSRESYLKYPLDAKKAWQEWQDEQKPKRWRATEEESYWWICYDGNVAIAIEDSSRTDECYKYGNYFRTKELAEQAAEAVKKCLEEFHESCSSLK